MPGSALHMTNTELRFQFGQMLSEQNAVNVLLHGERWVTEYHGWDLDIQASGAKLIQLVRSQPPLDTEQLTNQLVHLAGLEMGYLWHYAVRRGISLHKLTSIMVTASTDLDTTLAGYVKQFLLTTMLQGYNFEAFKRLWAFTELPMEELYKRFIGLKVLEEFRAGYTAYQHIWCGRRDVDVLLAILRESDIESARFRQDLFESLTAAYTAVVLNTAE